MIRFRTLAAALVLSAFAPPALADGPPIDTSFLKRYAETRGFMLGRPTKPKFTPDGKAVLFLRAAGPTTPRQTLFEFDVATGKTKELLTPEMLPKGAAEDLSPEEKARRERQRVSVGGFADYHLDPSGGRVLVMLSGRPWVFDRGTGKVRELNAGKGTIVDPKWSPDGKFVSYVRDYDVCAYDLASDRELPVTTGGTAERTHGLAEFVAQEEMDRHTGYWWSPDSKQIAYAEADHAGVEVWHLADPFRPDVAPQRQFYPRPGKKNVSVRLGVVPVTGGPTVWVEWDRKKVEYLAAVRWDAAGPLTIQVQNRRQTEVRLLQAMPNTGKTVLLAANGDYRFLNLFPEVPRWLKNGKSFVWVEDRAESHFPRHVDLEIDVSLLGLPEKKAGEAPAKQRVSTVAQDSITGFPIRDVLSFNADSGEVVLSASEFGDLGHMHGDPPIDSTQQFLYRYTFDPAFWKNNNLQEAGKGRVRLPVCTQPGIYTAVLDASHSHYAATVTTLKQMPATPVQTIDGHPRGTLPSIAEEPPFTPNVEIVGAAVYQKDIYAYWTAIVRPRNFDPKKKYPVIVDVYGGPHHLHVVQAMRNWLVPQWLADQGFVVVAIDGRGTPGRGRDWERAVYQKLGTVPLEDQVKGLAALCDKFPELDRERVGIVGWSFGGYVAANAVLRRPDVFRAAVAGAPVTDWEDYDTHYTERYLGLLPESRKAYDEASLLPLAKNLTRPLLLVHGTADDNVYYRHSLKLADALFRAGREFEALPLPGVTHMYVADPQVAERLWERTAMFFKRYLGEAK